MNVQLPKSYGSNTVEQIPYDDKEDNQDPKILRTIIFIPYNSLWQNFIQAVIIFSICLPLYQNNFSSYRFSKLFYYYSLEVLFLSDVVLCYLHRFLKKINKFGIYPPRHLVILAIDTLSVLPIFEFVYLVDPEASAKIDLLVRYKTVLRFVHFMYFLSVNKSIAAISQICMVVLTQLLLFILFTAVFSIIWSKISCWPNCKVPNWTDWITYYDIKPKNEDDWFILCYTSMGNLVLHNSIDSKNITNFNETLLVIVILLVGFLVHLVIGTGIITKAWLQLLERKFEYKNLMEDLSFILNDWEIKYKTKKSILNYFQILWKKRNGIIYNPRSMNLLPVAFQKAIFLDIFWEALRHSHLFKQFDMPLKRDLSIVIKNEFHLPGDYLMKSGDIRDKMIYIVSGIVQVLSYEDDESPILSFSSGTLLGDTACFMNAAVGINLRCATDCEVHVLSSNDLMRILPKYRSVSSYAHSVIRERILVAKIIRNRRGFRSLSATENTSISALKKQWKEIYNLTKKSQKKKLIDLHVMENTDINVESKFLDLYVLSNTFGSQTQTTCLRGKCSYVLEPTSNFRRFLRFVHMLAIVYQCITVPYLYGFAKYMSLDWIMYNVLFDIIYIFDLYIQGITAVRNKRELITDPAAILLYRMKSIKFLIDIGASLPLDYIGMWFGTSSQDQIYMRMNRIFKCYKIISFVHNQEKNLRFNYIVVILIKYLLLYGMSVYFYTCVIYKSICFGEKCPQKYYDIIDPEEFAHPVQYCFVYVLSLLLTLGITTRVPIKMSEMILNLCLKITGAFVYSFLLCEIISTIIMVNQVSYNYRDYIKLINNFMVINNVPQEFKQGALDYYSFQWFNNQSLHGIFNKGASTTGIKEKLLVKRICNTLKAAPIFSAFSDNLIYKIAKMGIIRLLPEGTVVCEANTRVLHLHFITRGFCKIYFHMPGDAEKGISKILQKGDSFPVMEVFHNVDCLNTIQTVTAVELVSLNFFETWNIIKTHKFEIESLQMTLNWHMGKYYGILKGKGAKKNMLGQAGPKTKSLKKRLKADIFTYNIDEPKKGAKVKLSFFSYLLFRKTTNPHKRFFIWWELGRSIIAVAFCFTEMFRDTLFEKNYTIIVIIHVFRGLLIIDIYVRLHIQYYEANNILITDSSKTAMHYLKTSMIIDLIATVPFYDLKLSKLYIRENYFLLGNITVWTIRYTSILFRPILGLKYAQRVSKGFLHILCIGLVYLLIILAVLLGLSSNIVLTFCQYDRELNYFICDKNQTTIFLSMQFQNEDNTLKLFVVAMFCVIQMFSNNFFKIGDSILIKDYAQFTILAVVLWLGKIFFIALLAGATIGGNLVVIKYRNRMTNFLAFINKEMVAEETIEEVTEHFKYIWKRTDGMSMDGILNDFYEKLNYDIKTHLLAPTLSNCQLFQQIPPNAYRIFIKNLKVVYYRKEAQIIRCNDIQQTLYFVAKGEVSVYIAKAKIGALRKGSVFGSFSKRGPTRQTIEAVAKVHVDLLTIDSNLFHKLIEPYHSIIHRVNLESGLGHEFIIAESDVSNEGQSTTVKMDLTHLSSYFSSSGTVTSQFRKGLVSYYKRINSFVKVDSQSYKNYIYFLEVHLSPIFCLILIFMQFFEFPIIYTHLYCAFFDCFYIFHVFLNFHLYYIDPESGMMIVEPSLIRKRYLKSFMCWVDLLSLVPLNLFLIAIKISDFNLRLSTFNRTVRFFHLLRYYYSAQRKLNLNTLLQLFYIAYLMSFQITVSSLIWFTLVCPDGHCAYKEGPGGLQTFVFSKNKLHAVALSFLFTVNLFTFSSIQTIEPETILQICLVMINSILSVLSLTAICGAFTSLLVINGVTMKRYTSNSEELITYLQDRDISPIYIKKASDYMLALWTKRRGELIPKYIQLAPAYLKQNIMDSMYGHYLKNHHLFKETHMDFLRQLVVHLKSYLFLAGQNIVEVGDVDYCMYFLHKGEILAYSENENEEHILQQGSSFGEEQGLFEVAHKRTHKAHTPVDILILNKKEWEYLLEWFPASAEKIYSLIERSIKLDTPNYE